MSFRFSRESKSITNGNKKRTINDKGQLLKVSLDHAPSHFQFCHQLYLNIVYCRRQQEGLHPRLENYLSTQNKPLMNIFGGQLIVLRRVLS